MKSFASERKRLEESLDRERIELGRALSDLQHYARARLDPRERVARHPYPWLLMAFAVGFLVSHRQSDR